MSPVNGVVVSLSLLPSSFLICDARSLSLFLRRSLTVRSSSPLRSIWPPSSFRLHPRSIRGSCPEERMEEKKKKKEILNFDPKREEK